MPLQNFLVQNGQHQYGNMSPRRNQNFDFDKSNITFHKNYPLYNNLQLKICVLIIRLNLLIIINLHYLSAS